MRRSQPPPSPAPPCPPCPPPPSPPSGSSSPQAAGHQFSQEGRIFPIRATTSRPHSKEEKKQHLVQPAQPHAASLDAAAKLGDDQEVGEVAAASLHLQDQLQPNVGGAMIGEMLKYWVGNQAELMAVMGFSDPS